MEPLARDPTTDTQLKMDGPTLYNILWTAIFLSLRSERLRLKSHPWLKWRIIMDLRVEIDWAGDWISLSHIPRGRSTSRSRFGGVSS